MDFAEDYIGINFVMSRNGNYSKAFAHQHLIMQKAKIA